MSYKQFFNTNNCNTFGTKIINEVRNNEYIITLYSNTDINKYSSYNIVVHSYLNDDIYYMKHYNNNFNLADTEYNKLIKLKSKNVIKILKLLNFEQGL